MNTPPLSRTISRPVPRLAAAMACCMLIGVLLVAWNPRAFPAMSWARQPDTPAVAVQLPHEAVAYLQIQGLAEFVRGWPESDLRARLQENGSFRSFEKTPQFGELLQGLAFVQLVTGRPPAEALGAALGREIEAALYPIPGDKGPGLVVRVQLDDVESGEMLVTTLENLAQWDKNTELSSHAYRGLKVISLGGKLLVTRMGDELVLATHRALLEKALLGAEEAVTQESPPWAAHRPRNEANGQAYLWVNTEVIAASRPGGELFPTHLDHPLVSFLFGDLAEALRRSPFVTATATAGREGLHVSVHLPVGTAELPEVYAAFRAAEQDGPGLASVRTPETLACLSLRRNAAGWWQQRDQLVNEERERGFLEVESQLGLFFSGRSIPDEILPALEDEMLLVVSRQTYPDLAEPPRTRYPAGALVVRPKDPARFTQQTAVAFHSLLGIINLERAKEGKTPMLIYSEPGEDTTIYGARFLTDDDSAYDVARYNMSPAMARVGPYLVLTTADELLDELIPLLQALPHETGRSPSRRPQQEVAYLRLDAEALRRILGDNREAFLADQLLKQGGDEIQARREVDGFLYLPELFQSFEVSVQAEEQHMRLDADLSWRRGPATRQAGAGS